MLPNSIARIRFGIWIPGTLRSQYRLRRNYFWRRIGECMCGEENVRMRKHADRMIYSQRNTFEEIAVQIANTRIRAATSPMWADHASPFQIPCSNDTA